jgi:uncharacterized protein YndB with AHSA1/START domain
MALHGSVTATLDAPAAEVFRLVTDIDRLPEWNTTITEVIERHPAVEPGAQWVVALHVMGNRWKSRSRVLEHDPRGLRFAYRSQTDDDNPSYGIWTWDVGGDDPARSTVLVSWELHPKTFFRRVLGAPLRNRQLRGEVRQSLRRLEQTVAPPVEAP